MSAQRAVAHLGARIRPFLDIITVPAVMSDFC